MKRIFNLIPILGGCIIMFMMQSCGSSSNLFLNKLLVDVTITSNPSDADVYFVPTGQMVLKTPGTIKTTKQDIKNGTAIFRIEKAGYVSKKITIPREKCNEKQIAISTTLHPVEQKQQERVSRDNAGETDMERSIIRWNIDSDPRGARVYYRVISSVPGEVKNTNETYLGTTPYEETRGFNILGLTYSNSADVTVEIKLTKRGYEDQVKRFNVRMALDQQELSGFFELVPKE